MSKKKLAPDGAPCWLLVIAWLRSLPHEHQTTAGSGLRAEDRNTSKGKKTWLQNIGNIYIFIPNQIILEDNNQDQTNNEFPDSSDNASFENNEHITHAENDNNKKPLEEKESINLQPNIIVNIPPNNDVEARRTNNYTRIGLIVNICLLLGTFGALWVAYRSLNLTIKSVEDSNKSTEFFRNLQCLKIELI